MPFNWFSDLPKPTDDIKLNKGNITITESGLGKLSEINPAFSDALTVRLGWDSETNAVAIAPANGAEKATFKLGKRGRSLTTRTINALPFYERYGIAFPSDGLLTSSLYRVDDGVAAFKLPAEAEGAPKKRRGRRKKSEIETEA